jgi:molybdenum cofactor cytidylyltransferase
MISAIVLAVGESKRMGETKQLLKWRGKIMLQQVLDNLRGSRVDEVILVVGHQADRILKVISPENLKIISNPDYRKGMSTSIRRGLQALDERSQAFFIFLGDQPEIGKEIVDRLIDDFRRSYPGKKIAIPTHRGCRGHPVLFSAEYKKEALRLTGDVGCREILADHPEDILEIEVGSDAVLEDLDTPEDYGRHPKRNLPGDRE